VLPKLLQAMPDQSILPQVAGCCSTGLVTAMQQVSQHSHKPAVHTVQGHPASAAALALESAAPGP
jgi:hypothetical protein